MSLNFNLVPIRERIGDDAFERLTTHPADVGKKSQRWHPVTDALIWLSLLCGFNKITEENAFTVATRIIAYENATGPYLSGGKEPLRINLLDVRAHIGMTTNASTYTDAKFKTWLIGVVMREAQGSRHLEATKSLGDQVITLYSHRKAQRKVKA